MNADVAVTDPRVGPITHPRYQFIGVHPRSSVAEISCLRRWLRASGGSHGFAGLSGFMDAMHWAELGGGVGKAPGSRFKGSVRNGLNGTVAPGFAVGSRFKGSIRDGLNGAVEPGFAVGSRFKGSVRNGLNGTVMPASGRSATDARRARAGRRRRRGWGCRGVWWQRERRATSLGSGQFL